MKDVHHAETVRLSRDCFHDLGTLITEGSHGNLEIATSHDGRSATQLALAPSRGWRSGARWRDADSWDERVRKRQRIVPCQQLDRFDSEASASSRERYLTAGQGGALELNVLHSAHGNGPFRLVRERLFARLAVRR